MRGVARHPPRLPLCHFRTSMALTAAVARDSGLRERLRHASDTGVDEVLLTPSITSAKRVVRERPVSVLVLNSPQLPSRPDRAVAAFEGFRRRFPSVPVGVIASGHETRLLHALGSVGLRHLLLQEEATVRSTRRFLMALRSEDAASQVIRTLSPVLGRWELSAVRRVMDLAHRHLDADALAADFGMSRPHLSRQLRKGGLPSIGVLMRWALLFHAGHWLPDPGRSGESVGRQLEYANGSTFRRALRNLMGVTPTQLAEVGLPGVLDAFVECTGLELPAILRVA